MSSLSALFDVEAVEAAAGPAVSFADEVEEEEVDAPSLFADAFFVEAGLPGCPFRLPLQQQDGIARARLVYMAKARNLESVGYGRHDL